MICRIILMTPVVVSFVLVTTSLMTSSVSTSDKLGIGGLLVLMWSAVALVALMLSEHCDD